MKPALFQSNKAREATDFDERDFRGLLEVILNLSSLTVLTLRRLIVQCSDDFDMCIMLDSLIEGDILIFNSDE